MNASKEGEGDFIAARCKQGTSVEVAPPTADVPVDDVERPKLNTWGFATQAASPDLEERWQVDPSVPDQRTGK